MYVSEGVLIFILVLAGLSILTGLITLYFLARLLLSFSKVTDNFSRILEDNKSNIDKTLSRVPEVINSVNNVVRSSDTFVNDVRLSTVSMLSDVKNVTSRVSNVTTNISDTVEVVGLAAADTASRLNSSISNATDYLALARGLFKIFLKRK